MVLQPGNLAPCPGHETGEEFGNTARLNHDQFEGRERDEPEELERVGEEVNHNLLQASSSTVSKNAPPEAEIQLFSRLPKCSWNVSFQVKDCDIIH